MHEDGRLLPLTEGVRSNRSSHAHKMLDFSVFSSFQTRSDNFVCVNLWMKAAVQSSGIETVENHYHISIILKHFK